MNRNILLSVPMVCVAALAFAQAPGIALPPGASPQAPQDPGYQALLATCKTPPPARGGGPGAARGGGPPGGGGGPGAARGGAPQGGAPAAPVAPATFPPPPAEYTVTGIPGVIAAGQKWTK